MPGKCIFNDAWLANESYNSWLGKVQDRHKARCQLCLKEFDIGNMGEAAVISHMKGKKHQDLAAKRSQCFKIGEYFRAGTSDGSTSRSTESEEANASTSSSRNQVQVSSESKLN